MTSTFRKYGKAIKRGAVLALPVGVLALFFSHCGSGLVSVAPPPQTGGLGIIVGDVPVCNTLSFRILTTGLALGTGFQGTSLLNGKSVLSLNSALWADYAQLQDTTTILTMTTLDTGTYGGGEITVAAPTMTVFDPTQNPPLDLITPVFTTESKIPFTISPPLVVKNNQFSVLRIDFNIPQSLSSSPTGPLGTTGSTGSLSVRVIPVFTGAAVTPSTTGGFGDMDDVSGYVTDVQPTSTNSEFIGSFALRTLSGLSVNEPGTGPSITVELTSKTQLIGTPALNQLDTDSYAEVNGYIDTLGNFIANTAVIEDQENVDEDFIAFIGSVLSVQKDSAGNATQLTMTVRDEEPSSSSTSSSSDIPLDEPPLIVNISPSTGFHFSSPGTNFAGVVPSASLFTVGQQIVVHGTFTPPPSGQTPVTTPGSVAAQDIYIPLQSIQGSFVSLAASAGDNLTGGFIYSPCPTMFQGSPIYVVTSSQTAFVNVNGLSGLTAADFLSVRGLLFFDLQGGPLGTVQVPPGSLVLLAEQVDQP
jgi:hypothetical protein